MSLACANVSRKSKVSIFTAHKRSLRRLCFYTCLPFILFRGGEYLTRYIPPEQTPHRTRYTPPWDQVHPPGTRYTPLGPGTPPWPGTHPPMTRYTSLGQVHPPGPGTPPRAEHAGRYGERAGGPHPTGMQSCFLMPTLYGSRLVWMRHKNGFQNNAAILLKFYTL